MAATLHDVARLAGVSIKTVSNVINDFPHVRPATRERVEEAIAELGYTPNLTARNLRSGRTGAIALAVPELGLSYFAELAAAVIVEAEKAGVVVLVEQTGGDRDRELELLQSPRLKLTDGLIFSALGMGANYQGPWRSGRDRIVSDRLIVERARGFRRAAPLAEVGAGGLSYGNWQSYVIPATDVERH